MLLDSLRVDPATFASATGWEVGPRGACKGDACVPLPAGVERDGLLDVPAVAERLGMPLLADPEHGLWALGPESGGRALTTAVAPDLVLPTLDGEPFPLARLRGRKVLLAAWASW